MLIFELFHYMIPFGDMKPFADMHPNVDYQHGARDLYWCYLHKFVP
jgi:hypothetical protein